MEKCDRCQLYIVGDKEDHYPKYCPWFYANTVKSIPDEPLVRIKIGDDVMYKLNTLGANRTTYSRNNGFVRKYYGNDTIGVIGEYAFANWIGMEDEEAYHRIESSNHSPKIRKGGDILGYEVRCRSRHSDDLAVLDDDNNDRYVTLVTYERPFAFLRGWIKISEGKKFPKLDLHTGQPPNHMVPPSALDTRMYKIPDTDMFIEWVSERSA